MQNDQSMLWLGLIARDTGIPASRRLNIQDESLALDFDAAVSLRLLTHDNDRVKANAQAIAKQIGRLFGVGDDEVLDAAVIQDRYADSNTQRW